MNTHFLVISRFLTAFPAPVSPRGESGVSEELETLIKRFVQGDLNEDEMLELYRELRGNEYAMEMLASCINGG